MRPGHPAPRVETVVDLGGQCSWCGDPLEPGAVVSWHPKAHGRVHEEGCLAEAQASATCRPLDLRCCARSRWRLRLQSGLRRSDPHTLSAVRPRSPSESCRHR